MRLARLFYLQQLLGMVSLAALVTALPLQAGANPIQAAPDGTGTIVNVNGQQFNITGGTLSGDKANLFHSFSQFGLSQGQIANFLSNPSIQNILSRVNSNNPSVINGLLQVSGSNANLFLINPSGIIFGPNASLNVPASFIATTANGVQFGNSGGWFNANGLNNYANLNGNPTALAFSASQPGAIINAGNLTVQPGQQISLLGGTVINTGTISTPGGEITVMAVPGQSAVRLSSPGSVLSLELPLQPSANQPNQLQVPPLTLAELLTGGQSAGVNTGITLAPGGQVQVAGTTVPVNPGTTVLSGQISTANPSGVGGNIQVLGQNVALLSANLNASGQTGGGTVLVGGDYLGQGSTPTALNTVVDANSQIAADALANGTGGRVIVWANQSTQFGGSIFARGGSLGGNGGFVETSGKTNLLIAPTAQVNASAINGLSGQWLLDPTDITISEPFEGGGGGTIPGGVFDPPVSSNIAPSTIVNTLNAGTNVTITTNNNLRGGGNGDITLFDSIVQNGGGTASLTLTSRRFLLSSEGPLPTINMTSTGGLTFNLNRINPETNAPMASIQAAHDAIGNVAGPRTINLFAPVGGIVTFSGLQFSFDGNDNPISTPFGQTLNLNRNVTINGVDGAARIILSGVNQTRVVNVTGGTVTLNGLTISGGNAGTLSGGGVRSANANLTINNSIIEGNTAASGGGLAISSGSVSVLNSIIRNNLASGLGLQGGGGIAVDNLGSLSVSGSTISGNRVNANSGGGIASAGSLSINSSTISGNSAGGFGGGIATGAVTSLTNSIISGNSASGNGGGIFNLGSLGISGTTITGNTAFLGGGIFNTNSVAGSPVLGLGLLTLTGSTLSQNSASAGGALFNAVGGTANLNSSTVNGNIANTNGGGVLNYGTATINSSLISGNTASTFGGGIFNLGSLAITGSTITGNSAPWGGGIVNAATITSSGGGSLQGGDSTDGLGILSITDSLVSTNSATSGDGGGILNVGSLSLSGSTLTGNFASGNGGGLANAPSVSFGSFSLSGPGATTIANSVISNNSVSSSGGGISNTSTLSLSGSTVSGNTSSNLGGGINNSSGSLSITSSTISDNTSDFGGGVWNQGTASIAASSLTGNSAGVHGGAIDTLSNAVTQVTDSVLSNNRAGGEGGGLYLHNGGILTVLNSTLLNNTAPQGDAFYTESGSTANLGGNIPVTGSVIFNGLLNLNSNTTLTGVTTASFADITGAGLNLTASGDVRFGGNVEGASGSALSVTTPGSIFSNASTPSFLYYGTTNLQASTINLPNYLVGALGDLNLTAPGNITTGPLANLNGKLNVNSSNGNIRVNTITLPNGQSFGGVYSQSGSVILEAPNGTLQVTGTIPSIVAIAPNGQTINSGPAAGASIYSGSPNTILINLLNSPTLPFTVGNFTLNGTAGRLQTLTEQVSVGASFRNLFTSPRQSIGINLPKAPDLPRGCDLNPISCTPNNPRDPNNPNPLPGPVGNPVTPLARLDRNNCLEFQRYFGEEFSRLVGDRNPCDQEVTVAALQAQLRQIEKETGQKSTIIYIAETPNAMGISAFFAEGEPVVRIVNGVGQLQLEALANDLRDEVAPLTAGGSVDASSLSTDSYLPASQRLYQALIAPIAADLEARGIQVVVFSMGRGLRGIPMAALHDGKQFLVEKYAIGMIPSLNLTQVSYGKNLRGSQMLAMGASQWESRGIKGVPDLPSVPLELSLISRTSGLPTQTYLNPQFTTANLVQQRSQPVRVVHLATHGEFLAGRPNQSFIRFWDNNVNLAQMRQLQLNAPEVDLLTLSACQTAAGDDQAELGFAGMAIAAGVKTTVASLWYVSDVSTMAMMSSFYNNLQTATTKSQALRQTQIAMLRGQVRLEGDRLILGDQSLTLTPDQVQSLNRQLTQLRVKDFRHPYFWSAFTMVGSPW